MTRREYFNNVINLNMWNFTQKSEWTKFYTNIYLINTCVMITSEFYKKTYTKFYNFSLKHSISFLKNNLFDIKNNKIIPMIDCKDYHPATAQHPEILGELI